MNKLQRLVTRQYIPGVPAVPPTPPYCYTVRKPAPTSGGLGSVSSSQEPNYFYTSVDDLPPGSGVSLGGYSIPVFRSVEPYVDNATGQVVTQEIIGYQTVRGTPSSSSSSVNTSYRTQEETICRPGDPGTPGEPAQVIEQNAGPDWRASARSIAQLSGDVVATFDVNDRPRVIVGFADVDRGANVGDIDMGVQLATAGTSTIIKPMLNGVAQASVGNFAAGDKIELSRIGGRFVIRVGGDILYSTAATTSEPVYLDAMLYTSADYVDNPTLQPAESVSVTGAVGFSAGLSTSIGVTGSLGISGAVNLLADGEAAFGVTGSVGLTGATQLTETESVAVTGSVGFSAAISSFESYSGANLSLKALEMQASDYAVTNGFVELSPLTAEAYGGTPIIETAGAELVLAPLRSSGVMYTGGLINSSTELEPLTGIAYDRAYGDGRVSLKSLACYGDDGFGVPNYYGYNTDVLLGDAYLTDPVLLGSWQDGLDLEPSLDVAVLLEDAMFEGLILDDNLSFQALVEALISSGLSLASATRMPADELLQLAFDLNTGAATRYDNFDFLQYAYTDSGTYAVKADGVYKLRKGDDDGVERSALVDFGAAAMTTSSLKYIQSMYIGVGADGTMYAKLKADDGDYWTYRVVGEAPTRRVNTGRGLSAKEWSLRLEWVDSTSIELESVEFVFAGSGKRRLR